MNKHHELLGVPKHANQHRLSRLTMEVHTDELRILAAAVESYTDELIAALEAAEKRIAELEAREVTIAATGEIIDQTCLAAAEIHNLGKGVSDDKAQFIIDRIREYLENGGVVKSHDAGISIKGE